MLKRKLYVEKGTGISPNKAVLTGDFINFCIDKLSIKGDVAIHVVSDRDKHEIETTAVYFRGNNVIKVYGKNRAQVDILRSIAHELTHLKQDEDGMLVGTIRDAGGEIEDEANAKAGELIKLFAKSKPLRRKIYEARLANKG